MNPETFKKLLSLFDNDPGQAAVKYGLTYRKLIKYFEWNNCLTPSECADETVDRVIKKINGLKIQSEDPSYYFFGVARRVLRECWRKRKKENAPPLAEPVESPPELPEERLEEETAEERRKECMHKCFQALSSEDQQILAEYFRGSKPGQNKKNRRELMKLLEIAANVLRLRIFHLKGRLNACYENCIKNRTSF